MKDFRDLRVWEKSHGLTLDIYNATGSFPKHEFYGLTSQLRRCAVRRSERILLKDAVNAETTSFSATCRSRQARPANWTIICCCRVTLVSFRKTSIASLREG